MLTRFIKIQLIVFTILTVIALVVLEMLKPLLRPRLHSPSRPNQPLAMDQTPKPTER